MKNYSGYFLQFFIRFMIAFYLFFWNSSINAAEFSFTLANPAGETVAQNGNDSGNVRVLYFTGTGETRKFFYNPAGGISHFIHINANGEKIYTVIFGKKKDYAVFFYNSLEWLTRIIYYRANGSRTVTLFRKMKSALVIEYDKSGSLLSQSEY